MNNSYKRVIVIKINRCIYIYIYINVSVYIYKAILSNLTFSTLGRIRRERDIKDVEAKNIYQM